MKKRGTKKIFSQTLSDLIKITILHATNHLNLQHKQVSRHSDEPIERNKELSSGKITNKSREGKMKIDHLPN